MRKEDLKELYLLLEQLNEFFHQPDNYLSNEKINDFAKKIYPDIHKMYYETVWDFLPKDLQDELENR